MAIASAVYEGVARSSRLLGWINNGPFTDSRMFTVLRYSEFRPTQRRSEIVAMCAAIRQHRVATLLEIGTSNGGTALLAARALRPDGLLVTVDIDEPYNAPRLRRAIGKGVRSGFIVADSHADSTVESVMARCAGGYDMVFIDGDHSYEGVRRDTLAYGPCVRPGGLIGFHDVHPDQSEPIGSLASALVGGVPVWWGSVYETALGGRWMFIDDPDQSGFGIGLIQLPSDEQGCKKQFDIWAALPSP